MKEKRSDKAEELESGLDRAEEPDELEEIMLEDVPEEESEDDWEEDEDALMKPWMVAAAMAGIVVLAVIICGVLWYFTHLEKTDESRDSQPSASVSSEDFPSAADRSETSSGEVSADASTPEPEITMSPEPTESAAVSTPSPAPAVTSTPSASTAPAVTSAPPQATAQPGTQDPTTAQEPISGTTAMEFTQINDEVTPKDVINLRSEPSTLNADNIVAQAKNGEVLSRTGVNDATGWSRIDRNGEILYGVSQYLTTDLTYKTPVQAANPNRVNTMDGRIILFTDCDDNVTPKEYVNLRTEPSTSEGETTVRCQISNGEVVHRTGYSPDAGWSRVEYNGEILYVVSSYVYTVE